ncbi:MAG: DUF2461 domain-containing protein [Cytophagales bacterium]|nr:DUF2461 domain-containing protein [Cytophagales bacterium]MDW8384342.1 DUF2461 domain-containing protein [Flammeovirgaceae bacterium]
MLPLSLQFLAHLQKNNSKEWFEANRSFYQEARLEFIRFAQQILENIARYDKTLEFLEISQCIFRIHRDVRFSKDKSPYKNNFGAYFAKGGKKSKYAGFYVHIAPRESFVAAGLWQPQPQELALVRQEIDYNGERLKEITEKIDFQEFYHSITTQDSLKSVPKGYSKHHPYAEWLKLKSFVVEHPLNDDLLASPNALTFILKGYRIAQPFIQFLNEALENENFYTPFVT